jgi:hypothetical protein
METIKLSEKDKKILHKYNLLLMAVVGDDGIDGYCYVSEDEGAYDFSGYYPTGYQGHNRMDEIDPDNEGYHILENVTYEYLRDKSIEFSDYLYCDDCTGFATLNINYNPIESKFKLFLEIGVIYRESYEHLFTFDQLKNQPPGQWGQSYVSLKKLGDPDFIEKMKNDYGDTLEITYDGGGDSGQINDEGETPTSVVRINQDIEYIGYEVIDIHYSGWEDSLGGDGRIIFDFENQLVTIYHTTNFESSENEDIGEVKLI